MSMLTMERNSLIQIVAIPVEADSGADRKNIAIDRAGVVGGDNVRSDLIICLRIIQQIKNIL